MPLFLRRRKREAEWIDAPDADPDELRRSLAYIRRINQWLEYPTVTLDHLERFSKSWNAGEKIRILDIATGSADIPRAILKWADEKKLNLEIVAIDLQPTILKLAEEEGHDPRLKLMRADAMNLPFADGSFDYTHTAMFLHHLDEPQVVQVLREMNRVAGRGILASDLLRTDRSYAWIVLFTLFATPMVKHDGRVSVAQSFTRDEILKLRREARIEYAEYHSHFAHRFALAGEKKDVSLERPSR